MQTAPVSQPTTAATNFTLIGVSPCGLKERHAFTPLPGGRLVHLEGFLWTATYPVTRCVVPIKRVRELYADYLRRGFRLSLTGQWLDRPKGMTSRRVAG